MQAGTTPIFKVFGMTGPSTNRELNLTRNFGISTDGRQYVILTLEDQIKCGKPGINFCGMTSAIYETNQHKYCTLAIYQHNMGKIKQLCQVKVTNKLIMPMALYVSEGQWLVATNKPFHIRKLCVKSDVEERTIVEPPFSIINLESGCRVLADKLELPIYFEGHSEYKVMRETRITTPIKRNLSDLPIWQPIEKYKSKFKLDLSKLPPIEPRSIDDLVNMLEETKNYPSIPDSKLPYLVIACVVVLVIVIILILCLKRNAIMKTIATKVFKSMVSTNGPSSKKELTTDCESNKSASTPSKTKDNDSNVEKSAHAEKGACSESDEGAHITPAHMEEFHVDINELGRASFGREISTSQPLPARPRARTTLFMSRRARR